MRVLSVTFNGSRCLRDLQIENGTPAVETSVGLAIAGATGLSCAAASKIVPLLLPELGMQCKTLLDATTVEVIDEECIDGVLCFVLRCSIGEADRNVVWVSASDFAVRLLECEINLEPGVVQKSSEDDINLRKLLLVRKFQPEFSTCRETALTQTKRECKIVIGVGDQPDDKEMSTMTGVESLYSKCEKLLGEEQAVAELKRLAQTLGEEEKLVFENEFVENYYLTKAGVELVYSKRRQCFIALWFAINTPNIAEGKIERYNGALLKGVVCGDSIADVEGKVGAPASQGYLPEESTLVYKFADRTVSFYFDGSGQQLRAVLVKRRFREPARFAPAGN